MRCEAVNSYGIQSYCTCQMLYSFIAEVVLFQIQHCQCLCDMNLAGQSFDVIQLILTVFSRKALAKWCAPSALMLFDRSFSVASTCVTWNRRLGIRYEAVYSHGVHPYCIRQMVCSFGVNLVVCKIQLYECLCKMEVVNVLSDVKQRNLTVFICSPLVKWCAPSTPMLFDESFSVVTACVT